MENKLPKRKHPRLDNYDYSSTGAYFVTICTQNRRCVLSRIETNNTDEKISVKCTKCGKIAEEQLVLLEKRYAYLTVDQYVIMPNHIHVIFIIDNKAAGASPRPTIMDIVCTYKSLTTRECKKIFTLDKLFQTSFYEHIIRDRDDYNEIKKYIHENPMCWHYDELYPEK